MQTGNRVHHSMPKKKYINWFVYAAVMLISVEQQLTSSTMRVAIGYVDI
jgi:hypothetical protein